MFSTAELAAIDAIVYVHNPKHPLLERIEEERSEARNREEAERDDIETSGDYEVWRPL